MGPDIDARRAAGATPLTYAPDEFIPLAEAARIAFPAGAVKVSSLRLEASRGRLTVYRIAGKVMTTLADVRKMADLCRVEPSLPVSGSGQPARTERPSGSSSTADASIALAALRQDDRTEAEKRLVEHIGAKHATDSGKRKRHADQTPIADVLSVYLLEVVIPRGLR